jgi:hypothetical protein
VSVRMEPCVERTRRRPSSSSPSGWTVLPEGYRRDPLFRREPSHSGARIAAPVCIAHDGGGGDGVG